jgi:Holliday junction resolvase RusA-like endonuclease
MGEVIHFTLLITPKGQPRHKDFLVRGGSGRRVHVDPGRDYKKKIAAMCKHYAPSEPFSGPVMVSWLAVMPRPKNHYRTGKRAGELKPDARQWHTVKPDRDNLDKALLDALNGIFWRDDSVVCTGQVNKRYVKDINDPPRWEVTIKELEQ